METIITVIAVVLVLIMFLKIRKKNVPENITKIFKAKYPDAKNIDWNLDRNVYEVVFFYDGKENKSKFDTDGHWIETKTTMFEEHVPKEIKEKIADEYADCSFNDISKIANNKGQTYYKLIVATGPINYLIKITESLEVLQTRNLTADKINKYKNNQNPIELKNINVL